jgi:hypothetical protein
MQVTSIVAARDEGPALAASLASLLAQTHRAQDIVIIEDGADAPTRAALDAFRAAPLLRIATARDEPGAAAARGLRHARGEAVAFLDAGDLRPAWALAALAAALEGTGADIAVAPCLRLAPNGRPCADGTERLIGLAAEWMPEAGFLEYGQPLFDEHAAFLMLGGSRIGGWLFRREFLVREGLSPPAGPAGALDLFRILALARARRLVPVPAVAASRPAGRDDGAGGDPFETLALARLVLAALAREPRARGVRFRSAAVAFLFARAGAARVRAGAGRRAAFDRLAAFVAREPPAAFDHLDDAHLPGREAAGLAWFRNLRAPAGAVAGAAP